MGQQLSLKNTEQLNSVVILCQTKLAISWSPETILYIFYIPFRVYAYHKMKIATIFQTLSCGLDQSLFRKLTRFDKHVDFLIFIKHNIFCYESAIKFRYIEIMGNIWM